MGWHTMIELVLGIFASAFLAGWWLRGSIEERK